MTPGLEAPCDRERALTLVSWSVIALTAVIVVLWMIGAGFSMQWRSAAPPLIGCLVLGALAWFYEHRRRDERIAVSLSCVIQLIVFTAFAAPLSYLVASTGKPLWDQTLYHWDQALGLDWRAYLEFVNARPWLGLCFTLAYQSIIPQTIIAAAALGLSGRIVECRSFAAAFIISGLISILVSGAMPAMAMFVHLGLQPQDYANLDPAAAFVHVAHLTGLRDGTLRAISLDGAEGIITFPSYHAALGVIFAAAFWSLRWLRWPGVVINALMIAATPIDGGHYFVDVLAGIVLAAVTLRAVRALSLMTPNRPSEYRHAGQTAPA